MKKLTIKEIVTLSSAVFAILVGFGLTVAGFIVPPLGIISDSVLWVLGQALVYAGSIFGISTHYSSEVKKFKDEIKREINNK